MISGSTYRRLASTEIWLLDGANIAAFFLQADYSYDVGGRRQGGVQESGYKSTGVQEPFLLLCLSPSPVSQPDLEDMDHGFSPRGCREEPYWSLDKL